VEMLGIPGAVRVEDALVAAGIEPGRLFSRPGMGISIVVNNETRFIKGEHGNPSRILVDGRPADTGTILKGGETVAVESAAPGGDAAVKAADLIAEKDAVEIRVNG